MDACIKCKEELIEIGVITKDNYTRVLFICKNKLCDRYGIVVVWCYYKDCRGDKKDHICSPIAQTSIRINNRNKLGYSCPICFKFYDIDRPAGICCENGNFAEDHKCMKQCDDDLDTATEAEDDDYETFTKG